MLTDWRSYPNVALPLNLRAIAWLISQPLSRVPLCSTRVTPAIFSDEIITFAQMEALCKGESDLASEPDLFLPVRVSIMLRQLRLVVKCDVPRDFSTHSCSFHVQGFLPGFSPSILSVYFCTLGLLQYWAYSTWSLRTVLIALWHSSFAGCMLTLTLPSLALWLGQQWW